VDFCGFGKGKKSAPLFISFFMINLSIGI
jgi:hypothetical protein